MRKGEALGLHWDDVHLNEGVLYVHCTLSAVDNNRLAITTPKTRPSRGWGAISPRVATALRRRARSAPDPAATPPTPLRGWSSAGPTAARSGRTKYSTESADLRFRTVGTTGFEPATPCPQPHSVRAQTVH
ncbi:hypothetical protein [Streptomyces vietnamensis]|uniref:hypothetical protein n=1 Tax=Streptomyces vietnamensis TaxID=362257 RepID=UPI00268EF5B9